MRKSEYTASTSDLFRCLWATHRSSSRTGSHDDTGEAAMIWSGSGLEFSIWPSRHIASYTSVQNSSFEEMEVEDDWENLLQYWRAWCALPSKERGYNPLKRRAYTPREQIPPRMEFVLVAWGSYHYGSSIRPRMALEVWAAPRPGEHPRDTYRVVHLEHVGEAWSFANQFLSMPPHYILALSQADAFKEYKGARL